MSLLTKLSGQITVPNKWNPPPQILHLPVWSPTEMLISNTKEVSCQEGWPALLTLSILDMRDSADSVLIETGCIEL